MWSTHWPVPFPGTNTDGADGALPKEPPATWAKREERVAWVLANFTDGELARLYELAFNRGLRYDNAKQVWKKEKMTCSAA